MLPPFSSLRSGKMFSPLLLREKLTARKIFCAAAALAGMILVAGVFNNGAQTNTAGILFGLAAAAFYASIVFCNKFLRDIAPLDATAVQLGTAAAVLLPYVLLTTKFSALAVTPKKCILLLLLGAVHTGAAYLLYFSAIPRLKAQTAALLSYLDPVSALFFSAVFLNERLSAGEACGAVLILAAAIFGTLEGARGSEKIPAEHS